MAETRALSITSEFAEPVGRLEAPVDRLAGAQSCIRRQESRALRRVAMQLENWVDPRHLEAAAQAAYAAAFALVPFTSVVIDNFLRPDKFAALQRVFRIEGTFRQRHYLWEGDTCGRSERAVTPEVWHAASDSMKAFVEGVFDGPDPDYRIGEGIVTHYKFVSL